MKAFIPQEEVDRIISDTKYYPLERYECLNRLSNKGLGEFIDSKKPWDHSFADPENGANHREGEGRQDNGEHIEASLLSKAVYHSLFVVCKKLKVIGAIPKVEAFDVSCCDARSASFPNSLLFHFDVMNNSNPSDIWRIGSMAQNNEPPLELKFASMRYTIGNFAPVPWWITRTYYSNGLQGLHNALSEWWDMLLLYLQWRMDEFEDKKMSFVDYIIFTCQFFYIENLSRAGKDKKLFKELYAGNITAEEFCEKIENGGRPTSDKPWTAHVKSWSETLHRCKKIEILSLMTVGSEAEIEPLPEFPKDVSICKRNSKLFINTYWKGKEGDIRNIDNISECEDAGNLIHQTDELISRLIEVRGQCIMGLLKENKELLAF